MEDKLECAILDNNKKIGLKSEASYSISTRVKSSSPTLTCVTKQNLHLLEFLKLAQTRVDKLILFKNINLNTTAC